VSAKIGGRLAKEGDKKNNPLRIKRERRLHETKEGRRKCQGRQRSKTVGGETAVPGEVEGGKQTTKSGRDGADRDRKKEMRRGKNE